MSDMTPTEREVVEKVLADVKSGLAALLETGTPHVVDLRQLPRMSEAVYTDIPQMDANTRGNLARLRDSVKFTLMPSAFGHCLGFRLG
jgi:hypothetical protein